MTAAPDIRPSAAPRAPALQLIPSEVPDLSFRGAWRNDLKAGVVVALVALPLCLGVALASGAPLFSGIVTGIVGGLLVSHLSGSPLMVSGPAAGLTAIVLSAITAIGAFDAFLVAVVLAGLMQVGFRLAKAGVVASFFPSGVIRGMLAAIGLILILKQLPYALGVGHDLFEADQLFGAGGLDGARAALAGLSAGTLLISALSLAVLVAWDSPKLAKVKKVLPAPLLVVGGALLLDLLFQTMAPALATSAEGLVRIPLPDPARGLSNYLVFPDWSRLADPVIWKVAVTIALVASLETLLSLEATEKLDPYKRRGDGDQELLAQGVGNTVAGLLGGLPMTGVIVRSAANVTAGGRTKWSAFFHGGLLLLAVALIPATLNRIPLAALAAILIHTGLKLAHPKLFVEAWKRGSAQFLPFAITVVAILATDLLVGIGVGLVAGAVFILRENHRTAFSYHREESADHHTVRVTLSENLSFLNKPAIITLLRDLPNESRVTIDGTRSTHIDPDVAELLHEFRDEARTRAIELHLTGVPSRRAAAAAH
jgi:MFS superfamily sulfate permease-like transporter